MRTTRAPQGQILVIALLALVLLSSLVFYVINLGDQVNQRISVQHSADAGAVAGATYIARSFNTVADNNIAMARYIAAINMLDGAPLAFRSARTETTFLYERLQAERNGLSISQSGPLDMKVKQDLDRIIRDFDTEVTRLGGMDHFFNNHDVHAMTAYNAGNGQFWRAMRSLDEYSQTVMADVGALAQINSVAGAQVNLNSHRDTSAMMLPINQQIPWVRGSFDDLRRPVVKGLLLNSVDDKEVNRGPFDAVFGWRDVQYTGGTWSGGTTTTTVGGVNTPGNSPIGGGPGNKTTSSGGTSTRGDPVAYRVFGTLGQSWPRGEGSPGWAQREAPQFLVDRRIQGERQRLWLIHQADAKLNMLWPNPAYRRGDHFALPRWRDDAPDLTSTGANQTFSESACVRMDIKSRYPPSSNMFLTSGSWAYEPLRTPAHLIIRNHWWLRPINGKLPADPTAYNGSSPAANFVRVGPHAWFNQFAYQVIFDRDIGIQIQIDPTTQKPIPQTAYFMQVSIYLGYNENPIPPGVFNPARISDQTPAHNVLDDKGYVVAVNNPYVGFDHADPHAPAPIDFDHQKMNAHDPASHDALQYFAIARQDDQAVIWPSRFRGGKPYPNLVGIAQARVFNDHSWDLWTPMWQSKLVPIDHYDHWMGELADAASNAQNNSSGAAKDVTALNDFMQSTAALAPLMLEH